MLWMKDIKSIKRNVISNGWKLNDELDLSHSALDLERIRSLTKEKRIGKKMKQEP